MENWVATSTPLQVLWPSHIFISKLTTDASSSAFLFWSVSPGRPFYCSINRILLTGAWLPWSSNRQHHYSILTGVRTCLCFPHVWIKPTTSVLPFSTPLWLPPLVRTVLACWLHDGLVPTECYVQCTVCTNTCTLVLHATLAYNILLGRPMVVYNIDHWLAAILWA